MGKSSQIFFPCDCIFGGLNPLWGWMMADVGLCGMLQSACGGSMCGNSHVCLSRFEAAFLAHGQPRAAESSAN